MKSSDISFYFILYLVAVMTVFAITVERDRTLEQRNAMIAQLVAVYVKPLHLNTYIDTTKYFIDVSQPHMNDSVRVKIQTEGPIQKDDIIFTLLESEKISPDGNQTLPLEGRVYNDYGDGVMVYAPLGEGTYRFKVTGFKNRLKLDGAQMSVKIGDSTYSIPYSDALADVDRDTTALLVKVVKGGLAKEQINLSVTDVHETWVVGPAFQKKIFIGGIASMQGVSYNVTGGGKLEKSTTGESYLTFLWDSPKQGKHSFTVTVDAERGGGSKDRASTTFDVDVRPALFNRPPAEKWFWGIPYQFDGQIAGINALNLTVQSFHDGQPLATQPALPPFMITPAKGWGSLSFNVQYHGVTIKEHRVSLTAPPPPQVKWVQQNLDRGREAYNIQFTSTDASGGLVTASLQSQPSGIATIDRIRGTSFTITVSLKDKPTSVFLKLTVTDQYGGQATSSKQFNLPQL
ncbi:MAG: hypothetical protein ACHQQQ_09925 [Bacteroidota bacterium]